MIPDSKIIMLLRQEEGVRYTPYLDSLGYPTTGVGFKLGPQGAPLKYYTFKLDDDTINCWLNSYVNVTRKSMLSHDKINAALQHCTQPRQDILTSMAYQMGVSGLARFHHMLGTIVEENWSEAAIHMLDSAWAKQTPARAQRHAAVIKSGQWQPIYNF